jgi:hypothetical protein
MKKLLVFAAITFIFSTSLPREAFSQAKPGREKLGVRIGYLYTNSDIKNEFGNGSLIALHFSERIKSPLFVDFTLGALYLGESHTDNITQSLFGPGVANANMRLLYLSVGPLLEFPILNEKTFYLFGGLGLYSVSIYLEMGFFGSEIADQHFGVNSGTGLYWPLSDNWKLDINFTAHHVWTAEETSDIFYLYSKGASDPTFYQFSVGFCVNLK